jgi:hypothetical protein
MTDLNEIIKDITKEYLQPKNPIYKITYIMSHYWIDEDDEIECEMIKCIKIFEILPELKNDEWVGKQQNNKGEMSKKCLDFYYNRFENERHINYSDDERQFILDIKRLA